LRKLFDAIHSIELEDSGEMTCKLVSIKSIEPEKIPEIVIIRENVEMSLLDKIENWLFKILNALNYELK